MKNIELLQLNFIQLTGSYKKFPKRLRWLCWHGFPSQYIPPEFPMSNLVVLDMSRSNLEELWKVPKLLRSLKIIDLSNSLKLIRTGDFSGLPNLELLILAGCCNLVEISESIGELHALELVDLRYCPKLRTVPRNLSKLRKMTTLFLDGCLNLLKTLVVPQSAQSSWMFLPQFVVELVLARCRKLKEVQYFTNGKPISDTLGWSRLELMKASDHDVENLDCLYYSLCTFFDLIFGEEALIDEIDRLIEAGTWD